MVDLKLRGEEQPHYLRCFILSHRRGFFVDIDSVNERVIVRFDPSSVSEELAEWKNTFPKHYDEDYLP
ncbi:MAG: hypothetical protein IJQ58_02050 [Synergistaceae bacterium]|nr:hypothetical protein [Synergistaceae bacterium]